jgi:hypothetical protein
MATVSNRTVITGLIFLNLLLVIFIVLGFVRNRQVSPMGPEFLIYELKLDSDQISRYKYLLDSNKNVMGPMLNELKLAKQEFFNEISSASVTESVLLEKLPSTPFKIKLTVPCSTTCISCFFCAMRHNGKSC